MRSEILIMTDWQINPTLLTEQLNQDFPKARVALPFMFSIEGNPSYSPFFQEISNEKTKIHNVFQYS